MSMLTLGNKMVSNYQTQRYAVKKAMKERRFDVCNDYARSLVKVVLRKGRFVTKNEAKNIERFMLDLNPDFRVNLLSQFAKNEILLSKLSRLDRLYYTVKAEMDPRNK